MDTMLQLIQDATGEMGIPVPISVAGNTASDTVQQLALLNALGNDLQRQYIWQGITQEYRFTTVFFTYTGDTTDGSAVLTNMSSIVGLTNNFMPVGENINQDVTVLSAAGNTVTLSQPCTGTATGVSITFSQTRYALPSDYDRTVDGTQWDKSKHWQMIGPETQQQIQWLKSGYISTGPRIRYYLQNNYFQIWPPLGVDEYLGFVYIGKNWVSASSSAQPSASRFTSDSQVCVFPDRLMVAGLKLKYFQAKGFDTSAYAEEFNMQLNISKASDAGSPTLSMAPQQSGVLISWNSLPDSGYGGAS